MNEKPILFSTPMVQAILDGRKTMTRRLNELHEINEHPDEWMFDGFHADMRYVQFANKKTGKHEIIKCPWQIGDILWVRETWKIGAWDQGRGTISVDYKAGNHSGCEWIPIENNETFQKYWIQSTEDAEKVGVETDCNGEYHWEPGQAPTRWRPSIFLPHEAARLFLRVTSVQVERLQDITENDVRCEGFRDSFNTLGDTFYPSGYHFVKTWDSLNAKRGYGWEINPWVFVVGLEKTEDRHE